MRVHELLCSTAAFVHYCAERPEMRFTGAVCKDASVPPWFLYGNRLALHYRHCCDCHCPISIRRSGLRWNHFHNPAMTFWGRSREWRWHQWLSPQPQGDHRKQQRGFHIIDREWRNDNNRKGVRLNQRLFGKLCMGVYSIGVDLVVIS